MKLFKKRKSKLSSRITWRAIGIILFFNVLVIGAILVFVFTMSLMSSGTRGREVTEGISGKMENMFHAVEVAAKNNVAEVEANLDSPERVFKALEHELRLNKQHVGCFAAFEPDYFKGQGRWFEAYAYYTDSTHIECKQLGSPKHDYFNGVWYEKGISLEGDGEGYLSDPYYDDSVVGSIYCSYVMPIHDRNGRKVGVYGIDLNLSWLNTTLHNEEKRILSDFFKDHDITHDENGDKYFSILVLDSQGKCIACTDSMNLSILDGEKKKVFSDSDMLDLVGTSFYMNTRQMGNSNWTLVVMQHKYLVFLWGYVLAFVILFFMGVGAVVIFFFMHRSIRSATKPLAFLSDSAQEVAKGNFDTVLPTFKRQDEIAQLRDSFDVMQQSLKQYVEELKASTAAKASIESELNVAHSIQMSMLPKTFPAFPDRSDIELYAALTPAKSVGGDLYDFFIREEKLFFCIGDVSGKGVPASLVMAVTRTLFRNVSAHTDQPSHIVSTMNAAISEGNDNNMFVTLFVGVLDLQNGHLRYCNAGHDAPYLINAQLTVSNSQLVGPKPSNLPIGVMPGFDYTEQEATLDAGTTVFLYTDGLTEAENSARELFGVQRIEDVLSTFSDPHNNTIWGPQDLIETITAAVHQFVGDFEQSDDLTFLAIKYNK